MRDIKKAARYKTETPIIADGGADVMSELKYWLVGKVSVPEEKKAELNSAVLEVLNLCGIRKKKEITLAGKPITVLERPTVDENGIVKFDYSIFEKKSRICSTYDTKSCMLETRE